MFVAFVLLVSLLVPFQPATATTHRYGTSCAGDSDCDQHQHCASLVCRCNKYQRRFWTGWSRRHASASGTCFRLTGDRCAICATEYTFTEDRCYKSFSELKTWSAARTHCRAQYADLFTWRDNHDERFIKPVLQTWSATNFFFLQWGQLYPPRPKQHYASWSGATVKSLKPYTVAWVDPDGLKLTQTSKQWCDPTKDAGYHLKKEPSSETRKNASGATEREECVTFNFGQAGNSLLCLADEYCEEKYPFICEMNAASMKLVTTTLHGENDEDSPGVTAVIDFEAPPPPPPPTSATDLESLQGLLAHSEKKSLLSQTNMIIFAGVGIVLVVGAVAGYMLIQKKKGANGAAGASQGRPSFASSMASGMEE